MAISNSIDRIPSPHLYLAKPGGILRLNLADLYSAHDSTRKLYHSCIKERPE